MKPTNARNSYIDGLRGISILVVLFLHYTMIFPADFWLIPAHAAAVVARNGYYGVTLFFVISGFLIASHTIARYGSLGDVRPNEFYRMRFARIAPLLLACIIGLTIFHYLRISWFIVPPDPGIWALVWSALTFQFNWLYQAGVPRPWSPLWSLSIEEYFYILFPAICLGLRKPALIVAGLIVLVVQAPYSRIDENGVYLWSGCADGIAFGCLTAMLGSVVKDISLLSRARFALLLLGLGMIAWRYLCYPFPDDRILGPSFVAAGAAIFLLGATLVREPGPALLPFTFFGRRSYEIYLIHMPFLMLMSDLLVKAKSEFAVDYPDAALAFFLLVMAGLGELIGQRFTDPLNKRLRTTSL